MADNYIKVLDEEINRLNKQNVINDVFNIFCEE